MKRHFLKLFSTLLTIVIVLTPLFGQSWTEHTIDTGFNGARSVYAADVDGELHIINKELFENIKKTGYTFTENGYTERTAKSRLRSFPVRRGRLHLGPGYGYFRHSTTVPILPTAQDIPEGFRPYQQEI